MSTHKDLVSSDGGPIARALFPRTYSSLVASQLVGYGGDVMMCTGAVLMVIEGLLGGGGVLMGFVVMGMGLLVEGVAASWFACAGRRILAARPLLAQATATPVMLSLGSFLIASGMGSAHIAALSLVLMTVAIVVALVVPVVVASRDGALGYDSTEE